MDYFILADLFQKTYCHILQINIWRVSVRGKYIARFIKKKIAKYPSISYDRKRADIGRILNDEAIGAFP